MASNDEPSRASSVSQPGLVLPSQTMQNQIHELAKTLPPPRKQNTACDACRTRKVKCNRLPGNDKCQHCLSKNYPCTHYVQQATSEKKRGSAISRRPRNLSTSGARFSTHVAPSDYSLAQTNGQSVHTSSVSPTPSKQTLSEHSDSSLSPPPSAYTPIPYSNPPQPVAPVSYQYPTYSFLSPETPASSVLSWLFSPPESHSDALSSGLLGMRSSPYATWGSEAHKLQDESFRAEFALDLVEVYFQIVHTRLPLLNPAQFRARLNLQGLTRHGLQSPNMLHPALVATVLAWGCKFSEHPLLVADRQRVGGQSLLAKAMVDRARELAEMMKVNRVPSADNVVIALLIEPLQSQNRDDPSGYHGFWLSSGIRNLLLLQINHKSVMSTIQDPDARGTMIFAWWMACLCDAYHAIYYRRKPMLDDDDYDIDFYTADPIPAQVEPGTMTPSPRDQLEFLGYYRASHALARIARQMARQLWRPASESDGIPYDELCNFSTALTDWRDQYLNQVGVPSNFAADWDFVSAVTACANDATYHVMWIILFNALDDFGVREINEVVRAGSPGDVIPNQYELLKRKVAEDATHGALRIAGLAGVLTSNGYLRLDPAVMQVSCTQAGTLLARLGRPEVSNCIAALEQYCAAYEEAGQQALEMKRVYALARSGEFDFNDMSSVAPKAVPENNGNNSHAMNIDGGSSFGHDINVGVAGYRASNVGS